MNKLSVSIALAAMSLAAHAQSVEAPAKPDLTATSAASRFVDHPYYCKHLLSGGDDTELLPNSYSIALDASLKETNMPGYQALARINVLCAQRVSALRSEQVSKLNQRASQ